jgi:hypothetical protein
MRTESNPTVRIGNTLYCTTQVPAPLLNFDMYKHCCHTEVTSESALHTSSPLSQYHFHAVRYHSLKYPLLVYDDKLRASGPCAKCLKAEMELSKDNRQASRRITSTIPVDGEVLKAAPKPEDSHGPNG